MSVDPQGKLSAPVLIPPDIDCFTEANLLPAKGEISRLTHPLFTSKTLSKLHRQKRFLSRKPISQATQKRGENFGSPPSLLCTVPDGG
jgi:hypothetical protein